MIKSRSALPEDKKKRLYFTQGFEFHLKLHQFWTTMQIGASMFFGAFQVRTET